MGYSTSLVRGLAILASFTEDKPLLGIGDLASMLDLNKSTTFRYVDTLRYLGYLVQDEETRKYRLGVKVLDLGLAALGAIEVRRYALPFMEDLASELGFTVTLVVLDGSQIVYVERIRKKRTVYSVPTVGSRFPAYCTSSGKALLAFQPKEELENIIKEIDFEILGPNTIKNPTELMAELEKIREQGFAIAYEEIGPGIRSVSAPVWSPKGNVICAVKVVVESIGATRHDMETTIANSVISTAQQITSALRGHL